MQTRDDILRRLESGRQQLLDRYGSLGPDELSRPCTESQAVGEAPWAAKDHLAHLAAIERRFQGIVRRALDGDEDPVGFGAADGTRPPLEEIMAGLHRDNQDGVEASRQRPVDELLADLDAARRDTLTLIASLSDEQLETAVPGASAAWGDGTVGGILQVNALHEEMHWGWVEEGLARG